MASSIERMCFAIRMAASTVFAAPAIAQTAPLPGNPAVAGAAVKSTLGEVAAEDWADLARYRNSNAALANQPDPRRIVFIGDSITEAWAAQPLFAQLGAVVGRGISGQTAGQMLVRFRADVLALRPRLVHILAGTNDVAQNRGSESDDEIIGYIQSMAELASANGARVVIGSIPPAAEFPWRRGLAPALRIRALNLRLRAYAAQHGFGFADYWSVLVAPDGGIKQAWSADGVHPNPAGYAAMQAVARKALTQALQKGT